METTKQKLKQAQEQNAQSAAKIKRLDGELKRSRKRIKDLAGGIERSITAQDFMYIAYNEIYTLLLNAVKISGVSFPQETFIKHALFEQGQVGYRKDADEWTYITGEGIDAYGFPKQGTFTTAANIAYQGKLDYDEKGNNYLILANEMAYPLVQSILTTCEVLAQLDVSMLQNVKAVRVPRIIAIPDGVDGEDIKLSVLYANSQIEQGIPVVKVNETIGRALQSIDLKIDLVADRILLVKSEIRNQLLTRIGILTANSDKRERVQSTEVTAHVGECVDSIYTIIDCFNKQTKTYGIDRTMSLNGVIEDYYAPIAANAQQITQTPTEDKTE